MSRLFDLERDIAKAHKGKKSTARKFTNRPPRRPQGNEDFVESITESLTYYSGQLGYTEVLHRGMIIKLNTKKVKIKDELLTATDKNDNKLTHEIIVGGEIKDEKTKQTISFTVSDNLIGFTEPIVKAEELAYIVKLHQILEENKSQVIYNVMVDGNKIKDNKVHGATLDLMGEQDDFDNIEQRYIVGLNPRGISWYGVKITQDKAPNWGSLIFPNEGLVIDNKPYMTLDRKKYPYISGLALRRYETPTGDITHEASTLAMKIVRPGSTVYKFPENKVIGVGGVHIPYGNTILTPIPNVEQTTRKETAGQKQFTRSMDKNDSYGTFAQGDPRHVGTHHPAYPPTFTHDHYFIYKSNDSSDNKWTASRLKTFIDDEMKTWKVKYDYVERQTPLKLGRKKVRMVPTSVSTDSVIKNAKVLKTK
ncbi:MAG: hypothetical protein AAGF01_19300 [Cyanobacteria bacterium P01_G01_bin.38]